MSVAAEERAMASLSSASLPNAFRSSAIQFGVAESDFLVMGSTGVYTYESFALKIATKEDLEGYLRRSICPAAGYDGTGQLQVFTRAPAIPWDEFKMSDDVAAIRKLWFLSKEVCKAEVDKLASSEDGARTKVSIGSATAMEEAALARGMPRPSSDSERPSLHCLGRAARALIGPAASHEYVPWEAFINLELEDRMGRAGKIPKATPEVIMGRDSKLSVKESHKDSVLGPVAGDLELVRGYLEIRARAHEMLGLAGYAVYRALNDRYLGKMLATVAEGMRVPTIEETRRFDRVLHTDLLRHVSRGNGTLEAGLQYHLADEGLAVWRLLDPVLKNLPDQGIDRSDVRGAKKRPHGDVSPVDEASRTASAVDAKAKAAGKKCLVCGERHTPFCPLPAGFRQEQRAKRKADRAGKKQADAEKLAKAKSGAKADG